MSVHSLEKQVDKITDIKSVVPNFCGFESRWKLTISLMREPVHWLSESRWFYPLGACMCLNSAQFDTWALPQSLKLVVNTSGLVILGLLAT